jgi:hypothetical protein
MWSDPADVEIPGLGTRALWNPGGAQEVIGVGITGLVVCTEGEAFVVYLLAEGTESDLRERSTGLARLVIDRL